MGAYSPAVNSEINMRLGRTAFVALVAASLTVAGTLPATAGGHSNGGQPSEPTVIASGLNNPRQLSFAPNGDLYVAEAGAGGSGPCSAGPEGGNVCFGSSGSVSKISAKGKQSRVLTGLPSLAGEGDGSQAAGPSDVAYLGNGTLAVLIGLGGNPETRAALGDAGKTMGTLQRADLRTGKLRKVADLATYEARTNPIHDIDSNPVGLEERCGSYVVADAGGNTVVGVSGWRHRLITLAVLPDVTGGAQAVATSTAVGPDGALYVSELTGYPFPHGGASIYRIGRNGALSVYASGLTNVTDLAWRGRTLYAVQISTNGLLTGPFGSLVKVAKGSTAPTILLDNLFAPYGLALRGNAAYVTTGSVAPGAGQVMRIPLS